MQTSNIPLCSKCGYATIPPSSRLNITIPPPNKDDLRDRSFEPTEQNTSTIKQWLPGARRMLAEYDKEVHRLRTVLAQLESVRDDLQQNVDHTAALVSPVRRLPTEVLTEIFTLSCIPETSKTRDRGTSLMYATGRTALRLSLVCSRWRSVALAMPKMWSHINVSVYSHRELGRTLLLTDEAQRDDGASCSEVFDAHPIRHLVELYLARSQDQPLAIIVSCPWNPLLNASDDDDDFERQVSPTETICDRFLCEVFQILGSKSSHRWRMAHINLAHRPRHTPNWHRYSNRNSMPYSDPLLDPGNDTFSVAYRVPLLEVLNIYSGRPGVSFLKASRLQSLAVTATSNGRSLFDRDLFAAPALRSLVLRGYAVCDIGKIFERLPKDNRRVDVHLEDLWKWNFREMDCQYFRLPVVNSLSVHVNKECWTSIASLCSRLIAKNATKMEFVYRLTDEDEYRLTDEDRHPSIHGDDYRLADEPDEPDEDGYCFDSRRFPHAAVARMIERSAMPLRTLKIDGFIITDKNLLRLLRLVPTIEVLSVAESRLGDDKDRVKEVSLRGEDEDVCEEEPGTDMSEHFDAISIITSFFLHHLTISSFTISSDLERAPLLPNLKSLSLTFRPRSQAEDLVNMVYTRWRDSRDPAAPFTLSQSSSSGVLDLEGDTPSLQSLEVALILDEHPETRSACVEEFKDGLRKLKDEGLDVQYKVLVY